MSAAENNGQLPAAPAPMAANGAGAVFNAYEHLHESAHGLSKRELFAAMAMQGFCALADEQTIKAPFAEVAKNAVAQADALLEALARARATP